MSTRVAGRLVRGRAAGYPVDAWGVFTLSHPIHDEYKEPQTRMSEA